MRITFEDKGTKSKVSYVSKKKTEIYKATICVAIAKLTQSPL